MKIRCSWMSLFDFFFYGDLRLVFQKLLMIYCLMIAVHDCSFDSTSYCACLILLDEVSNVDCRNSLILDAGVVI